MPRSNSSAGSRNRSAAGNSSIAVLIAAVALIVTLKIPPVAPPPAGPAAMREIDSNENGLVETAEFAAAGGTQEEFSQLDLDADGVLDAHEQATAGLSGSLAQMASAERVIGAAQNATEGYSIDARALVDKINTAETANESAGERTAIDRRAAALLGAA